MKMGWYTTYKIHLDYPIRNFDSAYVDGWCLEQENYIEVDYLRAQYTDPNTVYVCIKYGQYEIESVFDMLKENYNCSGYITIRKTDELEWPSFRESYAGGDDDTDSLDEY
jgi:hypothetical protein